MQIACAVSCVSYVAVWYVSVADVMWLCVLCAAELVPVYLRMVGV